MDDSSLANNVKDNDRTVSELPPSEDNVDQAQNPSQNPALALEEVSHEFNDNCEIDSNVFAASGTACCELNTPFNKGTLLTKAVTCPKDQIADLLSEGNGQSSVIIAAAVVPYSPLRVPSLAGDEPFQQPILVISINDSNIGDSSLYNQSPCSKDIPQGITGGMGPEVMLVEQPGHDSPLSKSSTSIKTVSSSSGVETDICRICHLGPEQSGDKLVSPCLCSGTVEFTHHSCLTKWLAQCGSTNCELCGYRFRFKNITAFRPTKLKSISITHLDRLHLLVTTCTILFFALTGLYVFWVAFSDHPVATNDRESVSAEILLPVYATLDSMAIFLFIYELKNTIWRLWCKWRVLNLGVVIEDRETRMRNHQTVIKLKEQPKKAIHSLQTPEMNQLNIQIDYIIDNDATFEISSEIFEPEVVVEGITNDQNESLCSNPGQGARVQTQPPRMRISIYWDVIVRIDNKYIVSIF